MKRHYYFNEPMFLNVLIFGLHIYAYEKKNDHNSFSCRLFFGW